MGLFSKCVNRHHLVDVLSYHLLGVGGFRVRKGSIPTPIYSIAVMNDATVPKYQHIRQCVKGKLTELLLL
jgi:hypothetical protein